MGLLSMASGVSVWRGYEYYLNKKVISNKQIEEYKYEGQAKGSNEEAYNVFIDIEHPRKSQCNCPHAFGTRIICKHMIALYFEAFPSEAEQYIKEVEQYEAEEEQREEELYEKVIQYIDSLSKKELQQALLEILNEGPEWMYDRFVRYRIEE